MITKGYLSYTLAALAMGGAVAGYLLGFMESAQAISIFWMGAAVFGLRRAIN